MSIYNEILLKKEFAKLGKALEDYKYYVIEKDEKLFELLRRELADLLINVHSAQQKKAVNDSIEYLLSLDRENFTENDARELGKILDKKLGSEFGSLVAEDVLKSSQIAYKGGINEVIKPVKVKLTFSAKDTKAAEILGKQDLFWIQNHYGEKLKPKFDEVLNSYHNEGLTLQDAAKKLEAAFPEITSTVPDYFELVTDNAISRTRELGKVTGFEKAGIEYYQLKIVKDSHTSKICLRLENKIIPVKQALKYRDKLLSLKSPKQIKEFAPWVSNSDAADVDLENSVPIGLSLPPYHGHCRTTAVGYFGSIENLQNAA